MVVEAKAAGLVCVTETWLNGAVDSSLVHIPGYAICRADRPLRKGGGTAVYVHSDIMFSDVSQDYEALSGVEFCALNITSFHVFLVCIYLPPNVLSEVLESTHRKIVDMTDDFLVKNPSYHVIIAGDLNKFDVQRLCTDLFMHDLVTLPTRGDSTLDHVMVSEGLREIYAKSGVEYDCPIGKSDHLMLTCTPSRTYCRTETTYPRFVFDLRLSHLR